VFAGAADAGTRSMIYVNTGRALYGASRNIPATESEPIFAYEPGWNGPLTGTAQARADGRRRTSLRTGQGRTGSTSAVVNR